MAKVSVELHGQRFEESGILIDEDKSKPLDEIPEDPWERLMRLTSLVEESYDAYYLIHGNEEIQQYQQAAVVYGKPHEEVLLYEHRESDFLYWFHEEDGRNLVGGAVLVDIFHEWFAAGGRVPDSYGGLEYVDTEPDEFPSPSSANEMQRRLEESLVEGERTNPRDYGPGANDEDGTPLAEDDLDDIGLDTNCPTR